MPGDAAARPGAAPRALRARVLTAAVRAALAVVVAAGLAVVGVLSVMPAVPGLATSPLPTVPAPVAAGQPGGVPGPPAGGGGPVGAGAPASGGATAPGAVPSRGSFPDLAVPVATAGPGGGAAAPAVAAEPVRVAAPAIGLDAPLVRLGVLATGEVEVPSTDEDAGWLTTSAVPGDVGPAVLLGHVDSQRGPAVFHRLPDLRPGDAVVVTLSDGQARTFVVTRTERVAKDAFPTDAVYGPVPGPQLRLITCGGLFDSAARSYEDNVVVFGELVA